MLTTKYEEVPTLLPEFQSFQSIPLPSTLQLIDKDHEDPVCINVPVLEFTDFVLYLRDLKKIVEPIEVQLSHQYVSSITPNEEAIWTGVSLLNGHSISVVGLQTGCAEILAFYIADLDYYVIVRLGTYRELFRVLMS